MTSPLLPEPNRTEPNRTEPNRTEPPHLAQFPRAVSPVRGRYDPVSPPGSARRLVPVRGAGHARPAGARRGLVRAARALAAAALLALAMPLILPLPAHAQTEVWSATLTVTLSSGNLGCSFTGTTGCDISTVLSDNDFTHDGNSYTIRNVQLNSAGNLSLEISPTLTGTALNLTFDVAGMVFAFQDANSSADTTTESRRIWNSAGLSWTAGNTVALKLLESDTTPPTLKSATVNALGKIITLEFDEAVSQVGTGLPPTNAFSVTAGGNAVALQLASTGGVGVTDAIRLFVDSPTIYTGQTVVVTYTDPTASDDTAAAQDTAGNDAASFTTGMSGVPAVTNDSTVVNPDTPTINDVDITSTPVLETDIYGAGETIEVSVTFSVAATATSDTDFVLSVGGDDTRAPLLRGSGTATLVFGYTVVSSDDDDDGIWIGDQDRTLVGNRNGNPQNGTIKSVATSTAADLTHAELGTDADHKVDGSQTAANTALLGITVNGTSIPGFLATDDAPQYGVSAATTTAAIVATAEAASATVAYSDADDMTVDEDNVMLIAGANSVTITVTDLGKTDTYTLGVNRAVTTQYGWKADSDFDTLKLADNKGPRGIWYDDATATFYVSDYGDDKVYAYNTDGTRDSGKDIDVSDFPNGIWSDGTTLWVANAGADKLLAYTLSSRAPDSDEDFDTLFDADNKDPRGVFSDGTTMWVSDDADKKIYAYNMDGTRDEDKDFDTLAAAGNDEPFGLWSDGTTMWVSDRADKKLYAYNMDGTRDATKDFATAAGNAKPRGLWSDGTTLWTTDDDNDKLFAYNLVEASTPPPTCTLDPDDDDDLWCGVVTVGADMAGGVTAAYGFDDAAGDLSDDDGDKTFTFGTNTYTIDRVAVGTAALSQTQAGTLTFSLTSALSAADKGKLVLYVGSNSFAFDAAVGPSATAYTYHWSMTVLDWSMETSVTLRLRKNNDPVFSSTTATREVEENSPAGTNVGAAVTATDADSGDTLTYSMEGTDATSFDFDASTQQITTKTGETYNYEATQNSYEVTVKAADGNGGTDTIDVTINVTDVNEQSATPAKPTLAMVMGSSTTLTATWAKPDLNGGPDITGYKVEYRQGSQNWQNFSHTGTAVTTTITGLTANTEYQVRVRAENGETDSDWSDASDVVSTNAEEMTPMPPPDPADADDGTVRLVDRETEVALTPDGTTEVTGIVEIAYNDEWRSVCDDSWTYRAARVVCRQLGYTVEERETVAALTELPFGPDADENRWYWLDDVNCAGDEATLLECPHAEIGTHNCQAGERAGVTCGKGKTADAGLRTLELSGIDFTFNPDTTTYTLIASQALAQTTVTYTTADADAEVDFDPADDADTTIDGHQVNLAVGPNTLSLTVTVGGAEQTYTLTINRAVADGIPPAWPVWPAGCGSAGWESASRGEAGPGGLSGEPRGRLLSEWDWRHFRLGV